MQKKEYVYFCVDIEASGPVPHLFSMISLGVVAVRRNAKSGKHETIAKKYWELKPAFEGWEDEAERVHKLTRQHLEEKGMDTAPMLQELRAWTLEQCEEGTRPLFVGHNAPFDWMFVNYYFHAFGIENPYGYNALDTKALAAGKHALNWRDANKEKLLELYPQLNAPAPEMVHNALADAEFQAEILIALLDG